MKWTGSYDKLFGSGTSLFILLLLLLDGEDMTSLSYSFFSRSMILKIGFKIKRFNGFQVFMFNVCVPVEKVRDELTGK